MASCDPFRQNHKRYIADTLLNQYSDILDENLFLSIGKVTSWGITAGDTPPNSIDSVKDDTDFWRNLLAAKRINRSDVSLVIRRVDWTAGAIYQAYRDNIDLFDDAQPSDFYALVDEERVYVCIDNNYDNPSLIPPTHTDSIVRRLSDGYRWKFIYQIPETKRKFLTKTKVGSVGYIPIEYVESLRTNDDRTFQWNVQQSAINGKIDFCFMDLDAKGYWVSTASCIPPSSSNLILKTAAPGATTVQVSSPSLNADRNLYTNMILSIDGGPGQGQRRLIKDFYPLGGETSGGAIGNIFIDPLVLGLSGTDEPNTQSFFSIQPKITVEGDGTAVNNTNNPTITTADFLLKFGATSAGSDACSTFLPRLISSIESIDGGRDYTFISLDVPKGLTFVAGTPSQFRNISNLLHAVIPPPGGHGANAPRELGVASYMIVKEYSQSEDGKLNTNNDFRQFGIVRNPLLRLPYAKIKFAQPGLTGTFIVGATAGQLGGPFGTIVEWCYGVTSGTGISQVVIGDIKGGTFSAGGTMNGLTIFDVHTNTVAGTEGRHLLKLTLSQLNGEFSSDGTDYPRMYFAHGVGYVPQNIPQSRSSGEIYKWQPQLGNNRYGSLYLENPKGDFNIGETVMKTTPLFGNSNSLSGPGKVNSIETALINVPTIYDLTTQFTVEGMNLVSETFGQDARVVYSLGLTAGSGYVIDWVPATGGTSGSLYLTGVQGATVTGQSVGLVGASGVAVISSIQHLSDLKYRTGDVLYIQNVKPIVRDLEQREEIKLVIDF